jgi:hypothetical protein
MDAPQPEHNEAPASDADDAPRRVEVQALTAGLVRRKFAQIRDALREDSSRWGDQLKKLPRGCDFDLRRTGPQASLVDTLKKTGERLAVAVSKPDDAAVPAGFSQLAASAAELRKRGAHAPGAEEDAFVRDNAAALHRMGADMAKAANGLKQLAELLAKSAAEFDPQSLNRILERKRDLGDATLRRIEDKIAMTRSRKDKKSLQEMRDEMRNWLMNRDARLENVQPLVDELYLRTAVLRNACLVQSRRLAKAAQMTAGAAGQADAAARLSHAQQSTREALEFSASLRALLLASHFDVAAPLAQA